jgi:hypothetical protein
MGGNGNHGLNSKTHILIETWILDAFKFFKKNNLDRIGVIEIQRYIEEYGVVPLKLTDMKYRKGNLSIGTMRLSRFLTMLAKMNKVVHIPNTTFWKRINEEQDIEEVYVPKPKYCNTCKTLLTPENNVGWGQRILICKPCFLRKRREYTHLPYVKEADKINHRKYYGAHREQELLRCKDYRKTHKEATRLRANNYYAKNKQEICRKIRERYAIKHKSLP